MKKSNINAIILAVCIVALVVALFVVSEPLYKILIGAILLFIIFCFLMHYMRHIPLLNSLFLDESLPSGTGESTEATEARSELVGQCGKALTDLRPAGIMLLNGKRIDVVTTGAYIKCGKAVRVVSENGTEVVVEETDV
jgi:membrane-bound serine protease (ClpP class)